MLNADLAEVNYRYLVIYDLNEWSWPGTCHDPCLGSTVAVTQQRNSFQRNNQPFKETLF